MIATRTAEGQPSGDPNQHCPGARLVKLGRQLGGGRWCWSGASTKQLSV